MFLALLKEVNGKKLEPFQTFISEVDNLPLKWFEIPNDQHREFLIISAGEKQPGRFQIFIETILPLVS
jgi:hypothetical protein